MKTRSTTDVPLLLAVLGLACLGFVMICSSSYVTASETYDDRYFYIKRHLTFLFLAALAYAAAVTVSLDKLRRFALPIFITTIVLLLLTIFSPLGSLAGGANRWIKLFGFRFQPSEFARLATIFFLTHWVTNMGEQLRDFRRGLLFPLALVAGVSLLILCEPDFGTAVSIGITGMVILYIAGARLPHLAPCLLAALPAGAYAMLGSSYRRERLLTFLDPWRDPMDSGFQIIQSFIAMRSGGFFGQGIGDGVQKIFYLPEAHTDFVFAILGEELGFIGVASVIFLFALIVFRGSLIAARCRSRFHTILAAGITFSIGTQAFTNMAVVLGILPTKGLTLPLISFGGSSMLACALGIGLLQNIAKCCKRGEA